MRIVSWNLWWRFGPWAERQKAILAVLRELEPDVVGLQEVWAAGGENLAEWLADELGLHCAWAPSDASERWQRRIGDPSVDVGNAVLSRWPVIEQDVLRLPVPEELDDGRLALYARLAAPHHEVPFFTTHLTSAPSASTVRVEQVTALAEFVAAHRGGTAFPPVVTGDFNAWPDSDEVRRFGGYKTAPAAPGQLFLDAWEYADPTAPPRRGTRRTRTSPSTTRPSASTTSTWARQAPEASATSARSAARARARSTAYGRRTTRRWSRTWRRRRRPSFGVASVWPRCGLGAGPCRSRSGRRGVGTAPQPLRQGRSFSGFRTAQIRLIRSPAISNANTVTMVPSCRATKPGRPLTVHSRNVLRSPDTRAILA